MTRRPGVLVRPARDLRRIVDTWAGERRFRRARSRPSPPPTVEQLITMFTAIDRHERAQRARRWPVGSEWRHHSQNGEDGIIRAILDAIGDGGRWFVEIGASDGTENCTRELVEQGWRGLWVEGDPPTAARARAVVGDRPVEVHEGYVDRDDVAAVLAAHRVPNDVDVVVVDVDGNDYWVLRAVLVSYRPRVIVVEYNSSLDARSRWVLPYDPGFRWDRSFRHGASLGALSDLAAAHGFRLVGCDSLGVNAFFVRAELAAAFPAASIEELFVPALHDLPAGDPYPAHAERATVPVPEGDVVELAVRWTSRTQLEPGAPLYAVVTVTNRSGVEIGSDQPAPVRVAWTWRGPGADLPGGEPERVRHAPWSAGPSSSAALACRLPAPGAPGIHDLELTLVQEGVRWFGGAASVVVTGIAVVAG